MNRWTLHVEDFGKIKKADIEVTPFTLFIGDNNSGKSYLMSLIWGLMNLEPLIIRNSLSELNTENFKKCDTWLRDAINKASDESEDSYKVKMDAIIFSSFNELLNECLAKVKNKITRTIFNQDVEIGKMTVELKNYDDEIQIHKKCISTDIVRITFRRNTLHVILDKVGTQMIMTWLISVFLSSEYTKNTITFLPASRTGFLLTYKILASKAIENVFDESPVERNTTLTKPISSFLSKLARISTNPEAESTDREQSLNNIAMFMEEKILHGKVNLIDLPSISDIKYRPYGSDLDLPLYLTSSVVTELTPLTLFLKYQKEFDILMMEEPELSLHPKLQWLMARVLIKLSNTGMPVFITTHSDTILQHVNNMIKLQGHSNREKLMKQYGYDEDDLISLENISMYQFDVEDESHKTIVTRLEANKNGFAIPSFEKTLKELLEEVWDFQEEE